jgi:hypothetical protein
VVAFGLNPQQHVLVDLGITPLDLSRGKAVQIDYHHAARPGRDIAAISVVANVVLQTCDPAQPEFHRLLWANDETSAMQLHAGAG